MHSLFIIIAFIIFIVYKLNRRKIKGAVGESNVSRTLKRLPKKRYIVLNNLLLQTAYKSSQIDHLVVSTYGLFVIETKRFSGWIHGNERAQKWTQTFYKNRFQFRNPIKQNWSHIYALKELLSDFNSIKYHNIVVFTGGCKLKNITSNTPVIYRHQLNRTIKLYSTETCLSSDEINQIVLILKNVALQSRRSKKGHVAQTKKRVYQARQKKRNLICPRCNGSLVRRKGRYGNFYGCSNYPQCRYTMPYRRR